MRQEQESVDWKDTAETRGREIKENARIIAELRADLEHSAVQKRQYDALIDKIQDIVAERFPHERLSDFDVLDQGVRKLVDEEAEARKALDGSSAFYMQLRKRLVEIRDLPQTVTQNGQTVPMSIDIAKSIASVALKEVEG